MLKQGLGRICEVAKSFDLAIEKRKIITKQKALAKGLAERLVRVTCPTCHSRAVSNSWKSHHSIKILFGKK